MGQIQFFGGMVLLVVFAFSITMFAVNFADTNDAAINIRDEGGIYKQLNETNVTISVYASSINDTTKAFSNATLEAGSEMLTSGETFKAGLGDIAPLTYNTTKASFNSLFGGNSQFYFLGTILVSFLGGVLILYMWKSWRGQPD